MYNSEILDHLISKYGIDDVIKFERDWWAESGKQLKQRI
jgi:hypothetical protein